MKMVEADFCSYLCGQQSPLCASGDQGQGVDVPSYPPNLQRALT
jgi:hypothetical protein